MNNEPKTLTLGEATAEAHKHEWIIHLHHDGFVKIQTLLGDDLAYEEGLRAALSAALGVPVVVRDEAAELRAALREPYGNLEVLVNLWTEIGYVPNRKGDLHPPLEELQDVLRAFRAALAATEEQP